MDTWAKATPEDREALFNQTAGQARITRYSEVIPGHKSSSRKFVE